MKDYSEVTCTMQLKVTFLTSALERKDYTHAMGIALELCKDLSKVCLWIVEKQPCIYGTASQEKSMHEFDPRN